MAIEKTSINFMDETAGCIIRRSGCQAISISLSLVSSVQNGDLCIDPQ